MRSYFTLIVLITLISLVCVLACVAPERNEDVLAEVGGVTITVEDLLNHTMTKQAIQQMIQDSLILLEAQDRGITLDLVTYKEQVNGFIKQYGTKEAAGESLKEQGASWNDLFHFQKFQILSTQIVDDIVGEPTEEELKKIFQENENRFRNTAATRAGVPASEITFEDVREDVEKDWKNRRTGEIWPTLPDDLTKKHGVKNYLTGEGVKPTKEEEEEEMALLDLSGEESEEPEEHSHGESDDENGDEHNVEAEHEVTGEDEGTPEHEHID